AEAERLASERAAILGRAAEEAEAQRQALIAKARAEAAQIVDEGRAALAREAARDAARMVAQIRDLAMAVARRALKAQPAGPEGYLARLAEALAQMDERSRAALLRGRNLTLVAAAELPEPVLRKARDLLAGYGAEASFRVDPGILAGLELHSDSGALLNSLAHDLDLLSKAMQDDRSAS
ncbi:ATP synthase subunit B family protein, partial [Albidovulum sp.]